MHVVAHVLLKTYFRNVKSSFFSEVYIYILELSLNKDKIYRVI